MKGADIGNEKEGGIIWHGYFDAVYKFYYVSGELSCGQKIIVYQALVRSVQSVIIIGILSGNGFVFALIVGGRYYIQYDLHGSGCG